MRIHKLVEQGRKHDIQTNFEIRYTVKVIFSGERKIVLGQVTNHFER